MTSADPAGQRSPADDGLDLPPDFVVHCDLQFAQVKAMILLTFGHRGVDYEAVTREAFGLTLAKWPVDQPIMYTRLRALELAEAARIDPTAQKVARISLVDALGDIVEAATREVLGLIDEFPDCMKVAWLCVWVFAMPRDQVAMLLSTEEVTVRAHLYKARIRLRGLGIDDQAVARELDQLNGHRETQDGP